MKRASESHYLKSSTLSTRPPWSMKNQRCLPNSTSNTTRMEPVLRRPQRSQYTSWMPLSYSLWPSKCTTGSRWTHLDSDRGSSVQLLLASYCSFYAMSGLMSCSWCTSFWLATGSSCTRCSRMPIFCFHRGTLMAPLMNSSSHSSSLSLSQKASPSCLPS